MIALEESVTGEKNLSSKAQLNKEEWRLPHNFLTETESLAFFQIHSAAVKGLSNSEGLLKGFLFIFPWL